MSRLRRAAGASFAALQVRNYRLYFAGQIVSVSGTWMQTVAQAWLVLRLTGSGVALGLVTALQFLPMILLAPVAGVMADRADKRRLILATQSIAGLLALVLAILVATGSVRLWMVYALAASLGLVNALDMPTRQSFVFEMVGPRHLHNAVSLNSTVMNAGRLVGPAIGGFVIATAGLAVCFALNALTFTAIIGALLAMRTHDLHPTERAPRRRGQLREGLAYVWRTPALRTPLLLMAVVGTFAYEFQVTLPLLARFTFGGGPEAYGLLLSMMSLGAVVGGLVLASRLSPSHTRLRLAAVAFGAAVVIAALMPSLGTTAAVMPLVGAASIVFITQSNANLQLAAEAHLRARVIALYGVAFLGSTFVGAPIVGWVGEWLGGRSALLLGALATFAAVAATWRALGGELSRPGAVRRLHRRQPLPVAAEGAPSRPPAAEVA